MLVCACLVWVLFTPASIIAAQVTALRDHPHLHSLLGRKVTLVITRCKKGRALSGLLAAPLPCLSVGWLCLRCPGPVPVSAFLPSRLSPSVPHTLQAFSTLTLKRPPEDPSLSSTVFRLCFLCPQILCSTLAVCSTETAFLKAATFQTC